MLRKEAKRSMDELNAYEVLDMQLTAKGNPVVLSCNSVPRRLVPFDKALSSVRTDAFVHFFVEDYQFERIWAKPKKYLDLLARFDGVLMPDFSVYLDMPLPMQRWNIYRNKFMARYFQDGGLQVIPIVQIVVPELLDDVLDGLPAKSTIAINCANMVNRPLAQRLLRHQLHMAVYALNPTSILCYGNDAMLNDFENVIHYENTHLKRFRHD